MKTKTSELINQMFLRAEQRMLEDGWKDYEVGAFLSDPVIRLFYGSVAEEISNFYEEVFHVEKRLISKTVEYLLPEQFQLPVPAHTIIRAQPVKKATQASVWDECQFVLKKGPKAKDLHFTPAGHFQLYAAEIEYMVFRDRFYQYKDSSRIQIMAGEKGKPFQDNVLWLGIKDLNKILPKERIFLFFTTPQAVNEQFSLLNEVRYSKCYSAEGEHIKLTSGIDQLDKDLWSDMLNRPDHIVQRLFISTRKWYQNHFVTLHNLKPKIAGSPLFPSEFNTRFSGNDLDKITDDIYWIKLEFNNLIKERLIHLMYVSINCFPALNLKKEQRLFDVEESTLNIYPINSDEFIMAINSIGGKVKVRDEELNYTMVDPELRNTLNKEGEAIFRRGSSGRLTSEKLKTMLNHLLNLLKEEVVVLTKEGTKDDIERLNRLNRAAIDFEKFIQVDKEKKNKFSGNVMLRAYKEQSKVYVRFWTTAAENGNGIKPFLGDDYNKYCEIGFAPDISSDSLRIITPSFGGKKQPTDEEYTETLRRLLLTRNRIVTEEDIKAFCYEYFHSHDVKVIVRKTVQQCKKTGQGLERMIQVQIFLPERIFSVAEIDFFREELQLRLEQHSANMMPFVVELLSASNAGKSRDD